MMARLGALMKRGWTGVPHTRTGAVRPDQNNAALLHPGVQGHNIAASRVDGDCLGTALRRVEPEPWPAEACRTVCELKARLSGLEEDNDSLRDRCAELERRVAAELPDAGCDLLQEARCAADEVKILKCEFLRTVSHELRNPLDEVQGVLLALRDQCLSADAGECVEHGLTCCKKLDRMIQDILEFKELSGGRLALACDYFHLADVLRGVEEVYEPVCRRKNLELKVMNDPLLQGPPQGRIWGDERRLRQILEHLLDNAVRFTPSGEIRVEAHILSETESGRVRLRLSVRDTGIGIPEKSLRRIQDPFELGEIGLNRRHQGPGLGLATVGKLAELMGGHLRVESMEGVYTAAHCAVTLETQPGV